MFGALNMTGSPNILSLLIFFLSLFFFSFLPGTDNESLEQKFSDLQSSFVKLSLGPHVHTDTFPFTDANKCSLNPSPPNQKMAKKVNTKTTLENHHLDWRGCKGVKGKKKNIYRWQECLDLARSLQPEQVRPHASPPCTACLKMLFSACKTV